MSQRDKTPSKATSGRCVFGGDVENKHSIGLSLSKGLVSGVFVVCYSEMTHSQLCLTLGEDMALSRPTLIRVCMASPDSQCLMDAYRQNMACSTQGVSETWHI